MFQNTLPYPEIIRRLVIIGAGAVALLLGPAGSYGQHTGMLVQEEVAAFSEKAAAEKIFAHLDRPLYLVGETIWLKAWCTDEENRPASLSKIAYVEVLDKEKGAVIQAKIMLNEGRGDAAIQIPPSIPSGNYLVRIYTNWMKNFSPAHFFESKITLLNPFTPAGTETASSPAAPKYEVRFFPEGGHLLAGVESKIGFKATDETGKGIVLGGKINDTAGNTVTTFQSEHAGTGHFMLTAAEGVTYEAEFTDPAGRRHTFKIPPAETRGYAMLVTENGPLLKVHVHTGGLPDSEVHLLLYRGRKSLAQSTRTQGGKAVFEIEKKLLKDGINPLVLFTADRQPVAERLWFHYPEKRMGLTARTDRENYGPRSRINLELRNTLKDENSELSVAVYLTDSLPEGAQADIESTLLLTSDIRGEVEDPGYFFRIAPEEGRRALDDVMLTHGWRRYQWESLLKNNRFEPSFLPEYYDQLITGQVTERATGRPMAERAVFAATPSGRIEPFVALSDSTGRFLLETRGLKGSLPLIIQPNLRGDTTLRITVDNPFSEAFTNYRLDELLLKPSWKEDLLKRSINMQTWNSYFPRPRAQGSTDSTTFYGKPDARYYLDDYTRFPTMEEVMREYIPGVMVRIRKGKFHFKMFETGVHTQVFTEDPLILMDGVPVFDTDRIIQFDPLKVKRADVINRQYYMGELTFPGIVSYTTYKGDLSEFEMDPRALVLAYEGTLHQREFYAPAYDQPDKRAHRIPDLRNLLYWNPSVKTTAGGPTELSFYTSDQPGTYRIVVQGISEGGTPGSATAYLKVVK